MTNDKTIIRPMIKNIGTVINKSGEEKFQNMTLRPIIKLQHELLIAFFENYILRKKISFSILSTLKKQELMSNIFKNDTMFKTELRGMIIGHFTVDEFTVYQTMTTDANKRILTMIKERLLSVTL